MHNAYVEQRRQARKQLLTRHYRFSRDKSNVLIRVFAPKKPVELMSKGGAEIERSHTRLKKNVQTCADALKVKSYVLVLHKIILAWILM